MNTKKTVVKKSVAIKKSSTSKKGKKVMNDTVTPAPAPKKTAKAKSAPLNAGAADASQVLDAMSVKFDIDKDTLVAIAIASFTRTAGDKDKACAEIRIQYAINKTIRENEAQPELVLRRELTKGFLEQESGAFREIVGIVMQINQGKIDAHHKAMNIVAGHNSLYARNFRKLQIKK